MIQMRCEACGKEIWGGWFGLTGDCRVKCGLCCYPQRFEKPDPRTDGHDPGDEDRQ